MSISVNQLNKRYGAQLALDDVSFSVEPGTVAGLLGPNGAGKSTLMKILTTFIPATSGQAVVAGFDVVEQAMEVKRSVGYLPESNPLYLDMYVREYLHFVAGVHQLSTIRKQRIEEMLEITGLLPEQHKKLGQLSKGYRQRVGLAAALIHDPHVLILDEPTSGLDPNQVVDIRQLIIDLGRQKTILLSTHIMQEVEAMCNRVLILDRGRLVADGSVSQLAKARAGQLALEVEFSHEVDQKKLEAIEGVQEVIGVGKNTWHLVTGAETDIRPLVFKFAVDQGYTVLSMQYLPQKLENVFRQLTGGRPE